MDAERAERIIRKHRFVQGSRNGYEDACLSLRNWGSCSGESCFRWPDSECCGDSPLVAVYDFREKEPRSSFPMDGESLILLHGDHILSQYLIDLTLAFTKDISERAVYLVLAWLAISKAGIDLTIEAYMDTGFGAMLDEHRRRLAGRRWGLSAAFQRTNRIRKKYLVRVKAGNVSFWYNTMRSGQRSRRDGNSQARTI